MEQEQEDHAQFQEPKLELSEHLDQAGVEQHNTTELPSEQEELTQDSPEQSVDSFELNRRAQELGNYFAEPDSDEPSLSQRQVEEQPLHHQEEEEVEEGEEEGDLTPPHPNDDDNHHSSPPPPLPPQEDQAPTTQLPKQQPQQPQQQQQQQQPPPLHQEEAPPANVWTLPADKDVCTLAEIRRGQVINNVAPNECPVIGCGKKINELKSEPSPGTIASGLRTHVLFVHYASIFRKAAKKRKLGWSSKRRGKPSPRKQFITNQHSAVRSSPTNSDLEFDIEEPENCAIPNFLMPSSMNLTQHQHRISPQSRTSSGSLLERKVKQLVGSKSTQPSSLQSLIQATGGNISASSLARPDHQMLNKQRNSNNQQDSNSMPEGFNQTTSSLFSILAGLTQQPNQRLHQQNSMPRPQKSIHSANNNTINITPCSRNNSGINNTNNNTNTVTLSNNGQPVNSSLLALLNEKISGNVASSLQSQLKKSLLDSNANQMRNPPNNTSTSMSGNSKQNISSSANQSYFNQSNVSNADSSYNNNNNNNNNNSSILNSLCAGNANLSSGGQFDSSSTLSSFIEHVAIKTGANIGASGIAEAKKIIEKFATSLISSSQTIADHYLAPYDDVPQQKPEISPSDVMLAYKMLHKSHSP